MDDRPDDEWQKKAEDLTNQVAELRARLEKVEGIDWTSRIQEAEQRIAKLEEFINGLQGQDGIDVSGNVITLNKKFQLRAALVCVDGQAVWTFDIE